MHIKMVEHTLRIEGPRVLAGKPAPATLGNVLREVGFAAREAVRMGFTHSSRKPGRAPAWLIAAEDVRFVGVSPDNSGATRLHFEAPRFGEVADEPYRQPDLFEVPPAATDTAFDLLGDILNDISKRLVDSERYDIGLLKRFERFGGTVFNRGVDSITVQGNRIQIDCPPRIDIHLAETAALLHRETPAPRSVRVAGRLDMIRDSDRVFNLILDGGERLRGIWTGGDTAMLARYFKEYVVLGGVAVFRPSGLLLRVDAEAMALAETKDRFFSTMPQPASRTLDVPALVRGQKGKNGIPAVFGKWPGDESEEALLAALKEMD